MAIAGDGLARLLCVWLDRKMHLPIKSTTEATQVNVVIVHVMMSVLGYLLVQDNTANNPAAMNPQHSSGTVDDGMPCNLIVTLVSFTPTCNAPCPFS